MKGIVSIASYPKSGNTRTRAFLSNLLSIPNDEDPEGACIDDIPEYTTRDIAAEPCRQIVGKSAYEARCEEIAEGRPLVQAGMADEVDGLMFVKTHNALVLDRGHPTINFSVTSGVIYVVRNPLDVAVSFAHHIGRTVDDAIRVMETRGFETAPFERAA